MQEQLARARRSKWICGGLVLLAASCWGFGLINAMLVEEDRVAEVGVTDTTLAFFLGNKTFVYSFVSGVASAGVGLLFYRCTAPCIVLHPKNHVWDPIKLLRRKTSFRYTYRSLRQVEGQMCKRSHALIPLADDFGVYLCDNGSEARKNNYLFMSSETGTIAQALSNKAQLAKHPLQDHLPRTYGHDDVCYPCILKYSEGYLSNGVFKIENAHELRQKTHGMILNEGYIIQEAIVASREYSTQFIVDDGKIVFQCGYYDDYANEIFIWPRDKRVARAKYLLDPNGDEFKVFEQFFEGYTGLINCNYKMKDGRLKILEFNPRLSGDIYAFSRADLQSLILKYVELCS